MQLRYVAMKTSKSLSLVLFGFLVFMTLFMYRLKGADDTLKVDRRLAFRNVYVKRQEYKSDDLEIVNKKRIDTLRFQCFSESNGTLNFPKNRINTKLHFAHNINVAFCKIPKCGSTFWMQFLLLTTNQRSEDKLFGQKRVNMHTFSDNLKETALHLKENYTVFMMGRNPYSRLYSAYVDKIYLPGFSKISANIGKKTNKTCGKDVTFEKFLLYVIEEAERGKELDPHWKSLYRSCEPCKIPYNMITKQETYAQDAEFIMNKVNIPEEIRNALSSALHKEHTNNSIQEITQVMISLARGPQSQKVFCHSFVEFCERLWNSFTIQGYIRKSFTFPKNRFTGMTYDSVRDIIDIYLEYASISALTERESHLQRSEYLQNAYRNISESTLRKIQMVYRLDFVLFGYDSQPPGLSENRK